VCCRSAVVGASLIACTLVGAVIAQLVVFHSIAFLFPAALLVIVVVVGLKDIV